MSLRSSWQDELWTWTAAVGAAWLLGALADASWAFAGTVVLAWLLWHSWHLFRLQRWLEDDNPGMPPEGHGSWGHVLDRLYALLRRRDARYAALQAELAFLRDAYGVLRDGVVILSPQNTIDWCNRAAGRLLGLRYPQDQKQHILNLLRAPAFRQYYEEGDYEEPLELSSPANEHVRLMLYVAEFGAGNRLLFFSDITKLHALEQMRKNFISDISHELRTPLTVIRGYLETLEEPAEALGPRWQRPLQQMLEQSRRMDHLLNDLMQLTRLETLPQGEHVLVDVAALCQSVCADAVAAQGDRPCDIAIDPSPPLMVLGDHDELHRAIANLVVNAVRYSAGPPWVRLRWGVTQEGAFIEVEDHGVGIDAYHLPRLTERFYRVDDSRTSSTGGTGLGLAIVKHVLLRHEGQLRIQSRVGEGSRFTCWLPPERVQKRSQ